MSSRFDRRHLAFIGHIHLTINIENQNTNATISFVNYVILILVNHKAACNNFGFSVTFDMHNRTTTYK